MAMFKFTGGVSHFKDKLINGMVERGYTEEFASRTFTQLEGFGSYGFPESHAASFAHLAYAPSWLKCRHPDVFCAALLNAQPMGFYAPAQIVRDAREHGVEVRPVCIKASRWDCTLEPSEDGRHAVRFGLRRVRGLANAHAARLVAARSDAPFASIEDVWHRSGVPVASLVPRAEATQMRDGRRVTVAGLVLVRQKPGSAKGIMFTTIEDETGVANLVIWPQLFEKQRRVVLQAGMLAIDGRVQREGDVVHVVANHLHDLSLLLASVGDRGQAFPLPHGRGDEAKGGGEPDHRDFKSRPPKVRDIYIPDLSLAAIRIRTRDFR